MKKGLLFGAVVLGSLFLTSCKKDWYCVCYIEIDGVKGAENHESLNGYKKDDAEAKCEKIRIIKTQEGQPVTCELKGTD